MRILDIHVDLAMNSLKNTNIIHSLSPLESGTDHRPIIAIRVDHVLDLLNIGSTNERDGDAEAKSVSNLMMAADRANGEEISTS